MFSHNVFRAYIRGPHHPSKIRVIRLISRALFNNNVITESKFGSYYKVNPNEFIGNKLILLGCYEEHTLNRAVGLMADFPGQFVDVGANLGCFTVEIARKQPLRRVLAIEPFSTNYHTLLANIALNELQNVDVVTAIMSDKIDFVQMDMPSEGNLGTVRVPHDDRGAIGRRACTPAVRFADVQSSFIEGEVALMKIDVEGYEMFVLRGIDFTSVSRPRNIIIEYTDQGLRFGKNHGRKAIFDYLTGKGYSAFDVMGEPIGPSSHALEDNAWFRVDD